MMMKKPQSQINHNLSLKVWKTTNSSLPTIY